MPTEKNINNLKLNFGSSTSIDLTQLSDGELVFYTSDPTNANKIMALNNSGVVSYLSLDSAPTLNSSNLLTSGAIYTALGNKINKVSTPNIVYGTDENGDQTTYSKDSFGQVEDVQVNGTSVVSNKIANVTVPTKTSDLTNDSGYLTSHQDISGKANLSGGNTFSGNQTFNNTIAVGNITTPSGRAGLTIESAGPGGDVVIQGSDYAGVVIHDLYNPASSFDAANKNYVDNIKTTIEGEIPTKTSDLTNDSGFASVSVSSTGTATDEVEFITVNGTEKKLAGGTKALFVDWS